MENKKAQLQQLLLTPEVISWRALMETKKAIFSVLDSSFKQEGYTVPRFQIMFYLYFEGPLSHKELGMLNQFTKGNTSTFLKRMISDSLIIEIPGNTSKRSLYQLSKKGQADFESLFPRHVERIKQIMMPLSKETLSIFEKIRKKIPKYIKKKSNNNL